MASSLRDRFVNIKLAGGKTPEGYWFRSNEKAADLAVQIVVTWLREKADLIITNWPEDTETAIATAILHLADYLITESGETTDDDV
jgi:hypothetical protein